MADIDRTALSIRYATAGVVAFSAALPLLGLHRLIAVPVDEGRTGYAIAATACYLPVQAWLVLSATQRELGRQHLWAVAVLAVLTVGLVPVIGVGWLASLYGPAALALACLRPTRGILLFAALAAAPAPVAFAFGHPEWALYFTIGVPLAGVPLAVVIRLVRAARQLQAARAALAEEAVARERRRIDGELRRTVHSALDQIVGRARRATELAAADPDGSAAELGALAGASRRALADVRGMVRRYQGVSLRTELDTAVTLLDAAGIRTRLVVPPGQLPDPVDDAARAALRRDVAALLRADPPPGGVALVVTASEGRVQLEPEQAITGLGSR